MDFWIRMILFKILNKGVINEINGCISIGKEVNVYYSMNVNGDERVVKVYKMFIFIFKDWDRYVIGEFRFCYGYCKYNFWKMVKIWVEKEMWNFMWMFNVDIFCLELIIFCSYVFVMSFIGVDGWLVFLFKDVMLLEFKVRELYF